MAKAGLKGKCYVRKTSSAEWNLLDLVQDLTVEIGATEISIKNKGSAYDKYIKGLRTLPVDFPLTYDPSNDGFKMLRDAEYKDEVLEFMSLDGSLKETGAFGFQGQFLVTKFKKNEPVDGEMTADVSLRLAAGHPDPVFVEVKGGDGITEGTVEQVWPKP